MSNDINLNTLWVPVMPETSKLGPEMRKAGENAKKEFVQGFSGGGSGTDSPEDLGRKWAEQFSRSFNSTFDLPMPRSFTQFMDSLGAETKTTERQMESLKKKVKETFLEFEDSTKKAITAERELIKITEQFNAAVAKGQNKFAQNFLGPQVTAAQRNYSAALRDVSDHQDQFISSTSKLDDAQRGASRSSTLMAGAVGALTGIFASLGVEAVTTAFRKMGEAIAFAVDAVMESGSIFSEQSRQIQLFSTASGEALEQLKQSAATVYGDIGSKGENLGETLAVLAQRLGMSGEPLERLTRHITELSDRFGGLNVRQLVDALGDFGVTGKDADGVLAMLVEKSRGASMSINDMVTALGNTSATLNASGLSIEQGASLIATLERNGVNATTAINQLQTAQKEFTKQGWTFAEGMRQAGARLQELIDTGDQAGADRFAKEVFGSRRWVDAMEVVREYNQVLQEQPSIMDANGKSVDDLIDKTESLGNKWENLKHKAFGAMSPLGGLVRETLGSALDYAARYFEQNSDKITEQIRGIGNAFIDAIPMIQTFAAITAEVLGAVGNLLIQNFVAPIGQVAGFLEIARAAASFDKKGIERGWDLVKSMEELRTTDFQAKGRAVGDTIRDWQVDIDDLHKKWNETVDGIKNNPIIPTMKPLTGVGNSADALLGAMAGAGGGLGNSTTNQPGTEAAKQIIQQVFPDIQGIGGARPDSMPYHREGRALDLPFGAIGRYPNQAETARGDEVFAWLKAHWRELGIEDLIWKNTWLNPSTGATNQMNREGPTQGHWDHIHITFTPGSQISSPQSLAPNMIGPAAGPTVSGNAAQQLLGAAAGAAGLPPILVGPGANVPRGSGPLLGVPQPNSTQVPQNTAPAPAPVAPTASAPARKPGWTYDADGKPLSAPEGTSQAEFFGDVVAWYRSKNLPVPEAYSQYAPAPAQTPSAPTPLPPAPQMPSVAPPLGAVPSVPLMPAPPTPETNDALLAALPPGVDVPDDIKALIASGALPLDAATNPELRKYPGLPGQYGGFGQYGAQDYQSATRNQTAIRDAQQRLSDADASIAEKQRAIGELEKKAAAVRAETDVWGKVDPEKVRAADQAVIDAKNDLARMVRERSDDEGRYNDAVRKAQEDAMKVPDLAKTKRQKRTTDKLSGLEAFGQLGNSLLGGIAESLGLDMFGEAPWEWGIFKLAASLGNYGFGTANAWADHIGAGKTGLTGNQPIPGWEDDGGLLNFVLGNGAGPGMPGMPNAVSTNPLQVTAGPNVSVNPSGSAHGMGQGQMPGPVSVDNSINVTNNGPKQSDYDAWKQGQNSRTNSAMASMPR